MRTIYFTDRDKFTRPHLYSAEVAHELRDFFCIEEATKLIGTYPYPDATVPKWAAFNTLEDAANAFKNAQEVAEKEARKKLDLMDKDRNNLDLLLTNQRK